MSTKTPSDWLDINKKSWDDRAKLHIKSPFYDVAGFKKGNNTLHSIELDILGDIKKKKILHLQCHFGLDTFSLERLGAQVTGVDFSEKSIEYANMLKTEMGLTSEFICSDVYSLDLNSSHKFDTLFCSYGITGWLPDLDKWARVISKHVQSNGTFVLVDFHPALWMFDDDFQSIAYSYFNDQAYVEKQDGSYADRNSKEEITSIWWSHSLSEITQSLLNQNMILENFQEYDYSPFNCFQHTVKVDEHKFRIQHLDAKIPMVYSMVFKKQ